MKEPADPEPETAANSNYPKKGFVHRRRKMARRIAIAMVMLGTACVAACVSLVCWLA